MLKQRVGAVLGTMLFSTWTASIEASENFRVMSYNVENLWDASPHNTSDVWQDFLEKLASQDISSAGLRHIQYSDYSIEKSNWYKASILDAKIRGILEVLALGDYPEVVALQEVESSGNESEVFFMHGKHLHLQKELKKLGYKHFLLGKQDPNNPVSVTQAVISKVPLHPLDEVRVHFESQPYSSSARDIQVVEFQKGEHRMLIFNNHWKSKFGGKKTEILRVETAKMLKKRIQEEREKDPYTRIIVLGDLNSAYDEIPIGVLATKDESAMLQDYSEKLYNTWYEMPEEDRWEYSYKGERSSLTAILISDDFYYDSGIQYVDNSFQVLGHHGRASQKLLNADGTPLRWQKKKRRGYTTHFGKGYSDHLPLIANFKIVSNTNSMEKWSQVHQDPENLHSQRDVYLDKVPLCKKEEIVNISKIDFSKDTWFQKCVSIQGKYPLLDGEGDYANSFITLKNKAKTIITLAMTRSWDDRPNIDDSRIGERSYHKKPYYKGKRDGNPRSNKCFHRKVLRGAGGILKKAIGRLGYHDGQVAIYIPTRERRHLILEDLPEKKELACPW